MPQASDEKQLKELGRAVIATEASAVQNLVDRIDDSFVTACRHMLACEGRIVVIGMGKSGHIGGKVAATFASTGTPAFFVHPGEASHGDLGMITSKDVVLAFSNSGETSEILTILPLIKRLGVPLISLTGRPQSTLARESDVHLDVSVEKEACPLGLAPTTSTTVSLVMGDALAVSLLESRGFTAQDFALSHPAGTLGRRLLLHVKDIMHTGEDMPQVSEDTHLGDVLVEMTRKGLGITVVTDQQGHVAGVFTDGDLRRLLDHGEVNVYTMCIIDHVTSNCKTAHPNMLAAEVLKMMDQYKINALPVVDDDMKLVGAINMHDLLRAGVV